MGYLNINGPPRRHASVTTRSAPCNNPVAFRNASRMHRPLPPTCVQKKKRKRRKKTEGRKGRKSINNIEKFESRLRAEAAGCALAQQVHAGCIASLVEGWRVTGLGGVVWEKWGVERGGGRAEAELNARRGRGHTTRRRARGWHAPSATIHSEKRESERDARGELGRER